MTPKESQAVADVVVEMAEWLDNDDMNLMTIQDAVIRWSAKLSAIVRAKAASK